MMNKQVQIICWAILIVVMAIMPQIVGLYYLNTITTFVIFATLSVSLNMLLGYTGLLSFGQAMFFGVGGYGTALALTHIDGLALLAGHRYRGVVGPGSGGDCIPSCFSGGWNNLCHDDPGLWPVPVCSIPQVAERHRWGRRDW